MRRQPVNVVEGAALVAWALATLAGMAARGVGAGLAGGILALGAPPWLWMIAYAVLRRLPAGKRQGRRLSRRPGPLVLVILAALVLRLAWPVLVVAPFAVGEVPARVDLAAFLMWPGTVPWPVAPAVALVLWQARRRDAALRTRAAALMAALPAALVAPVLTGPVPAEAVGALYWLAFGLFNGLYSERSRLHPPPSLAALAGREATPSGAEAGWGQATGSETAAVAAGGAGAPARPAPEKAPFDPASTRIVISGFYGAGNAGDEAILASLLAGLRARGYRDITVFSIRPEDTARRHGVASVYRGWRCHLWAKVRALARAHVFISGGGGLLQDTTPTFLFRGPVPYYLLIATLARLLGCWVLFLGQGVGPLRGSWARFLTRLLGNHADAITVRDAGSLDLLAEVGVTRPPRWLAADFAFAAPPPDPRRAEAVAAREGLDPAARRLVVSVRSWPGRERFFPELAAFLQQVLARDPDLRVVLVPMEGEMDRAASEELAACLAPPGAGQGGGDAAGRAGPVRDRVHVMSAGYDPADLEAFIAASWLAVGMRLHFLLFAARAGVPVLALSYDPKVAAAMDRLGMSRFVLGLDEVRSGRLLAAYEELVARYDEISRALAREAAALAPLAAASLDLVDAAAARAGLPVERC